MSAERAPAPAAAPSPLRRVRSAVTRYRRSGDTRILVGCPKGAWQPRLARCRVGTRAYEVIKLNATSCAGRGRRRRR